MKPLCSPESDFTQRACSGLPGQRHAERLTRGPHTGTSAPVFPWAPCLCVNVLPSHKSNSFQLPEVEVLCRHFPPRTIPLLLEGRGLPSSAPPPRKALRCPPRLPYDSEAPVQSAPVPGLRPECPRPPLPHCFPPPPPGGTPRTVRPVQVLGAGNHSSPGEPFVTERHLRV